MEPLEKAEQLKAELDSLRPLDGETERRILQKFRLDWNYHSNKLEGNSLTFGETKALILFGITAQGKPLKDHFEITGHDEAIKWVEELVRGESPLTEQFIRELHVLLLKENHHIDAMTSEGQPTRRLIEVGKYKTLPNHVLTKTGEMFYFASPEETPAKMQELVEWFRGEREKLDVNPIILASLFHYRFIRIHPFDDGNGRVARILMNFILMQFGYPPVIIKTEDKENYYGVLHLADVGEQEPFIEYIGNNLIHSLEIMIRGARGEDIEEPDDLDKELALLDKKFNQFGEKAQIAKNESSIIDVIENQLASFLISFFATCKKFNRFYFSSSFFVSINSDHFVTTGYRFLRIKIDHKRSIEEIIIEIQKFLHDYVAYYTGRSYEDLIHEVEFEYEYEKFNRLHDRDINYSSEAYFVFKDRTFLISDTESKASIQKIYGKGLLDKEVKEICSKISEDHLKFLESLDFT